MNQSTMLAAHRTSHKPDDLIVCRKNFANTEYQKAVDSAKDAQTSLHAAEASAAEATHQMQDQKSKTDTAKVVASH